MKKFMIILLLAILAFTIGQAQATDNETQGGGYKPKITIKCCDKVKVKKEGYHEKIIDTDYCIEAREYDRQHGYRYERHDNIFKGRCCVLVAFKEKYGGSRTGDSKHQEPKDEPIQILDICNPGAECKKCHKIKNFYENKPRTGSYEYEVKCKCEKYICK